MDEPRQNQSTTSIQITALDGIINVNSLFTLAVFLGLAWNPNDPSNILVTDPSCLAGQKIAEDLVSFHVFSFSSFLFSSLVALGVKQAVRLAKTGACGSMRAHVNGNMRAHVNKTFLRFGLLTSAVGSVCGCGFLMMALVNLVQIKLGTLACGSSWSIGAIVPLVILVPLALLIYVCIVIYAFTR
ncbi:maternal effect embryo arrest 60 [Tasmannia lanceolata]|uniref:maternal effect embryo arrest 60 n=1 Tax=Tasmannia lanceolata TaxID=3420 RepID=UPI0040645D62